MLMNWQNGNISNGGFPVGRSYSYVAFQIIINVIFLSNINGQHLPNTVIISVATFFLWAARIRRSTKGSEYKMFPDLLPRPGVSLAPASFISAFPLDM